MKRIYIKPVMTVVQLQQQSHLLLGSDKKVSTDLDGWDSDGYEEKGGNQGFAW